MDVVVPRRRRVPRLAVAGILGALAIGVVIWALLPRGLPVARNTIRVASVNEEVFRDEIMLRAVAEPYHSVILDAVESGRVEEVFTRDGAIVEKGEVLFRLSNPQRSLDLLARQSDEAQQISNTLTLRLTLEASQTEHLRRVADAEYLLSQAKIQHDRNKALAPQGYITPTELQDSELRVRHHERLLRVEKESGAAEIKIKQDAVAQMERAIQRLQSGLELVQASVEALTVKAPIAGRLTDFRLQIGETVKPDQHIGRIDDPDRFKLAASVDEFYSDRVKVDRPGVVTLQDEQFPVKVSRVYLQIKDGRFGVELVFTAAQPKNLTPGQSISTQITLGEPAPALVLPNGPFFNDTRGGWVYVVSSRGNTAERREIRVGRRSTSQIEVLSGLKPGEKVVVSSYASYGDETRLELRD